MSSGQISRDGACYSFSILTFDVYNFLAVSAMKKKLEKEAMEQGEDD